MKSETILIQWIIFLLYYILLTIAVESNLYERYCFNGDKPVRNCRFSQSGLCSPTNESQPCIGSEKVIIGFISIPMLYI